MTRNAMDNRIGNYALVLALAGWVISAAPVRAQISCDDDGFGRARDAYEREQLMETIRLLQPCVDQLGMLNDTRKKQVLQLLAFAYFYRDMPDSSSQMVRLLVRKVDRGYRAQLDDPQFFRDLIKKNRIRWYQKRWVQVGSGAAISGIVIYILTRPKPLPGASEDIWPPKY